VNNTVLGPQTSIELLRLKYEVKINKAILDVHGTFGDEILEHITTPDYAGQDAPHIQLLQVFRLVQDS